MLALRALCATLLLVALPLRAQAPALADLWRVAEATLAGPSPFARGAAGTFWNPASVAEGRSRRFAIEVLETPSVLALSGLLGSVTWRSGGGFAAGALIGRMAVSDLVRTTTSPASQPGEITVHSQLLGAAIGYGTETLAIGLLVRAHEARLDAAADRGLTTDVGVRWHPTRFASVAAASRFADPPLGRTGTTEYTMAGEAHVPIGIVWGSQAQLVPAIGIGWHGVGGRELTGALALTLNDQFRASWRLARERGLGSVEWRNTLGIGFRAGQYAIMVARGDGLNGLGATYRLGLALESSP